ncbi:hypothetical protein KY289_023344 [Solanum tuberosum]|nr:hypothetical protein KY289_023344 [Solanum tuberosum]
MAGRTTLRGNGEKWGYSSVMGQENVESHQKGVVEGSNQSKEHMHRTLAVLRGFQCDKISHGKINWTEINRGYV